MAYDNLCKYLSEKYPQQFATWLLKQVLAPVEVLKTELSLEPIRADSVTFLQIEGRILHLEFQLEVVSDPPLPLRMLDYWVRLHRRYRLPVTQVIVLLKATPAAATLEDKFSLEGTQHRFQVVRLWEQDPQTLLQDQALLPLAVLASTEAPEQLLSQVAARVSKIESAARQEVSACAQVLAGLRFDKQTIRQIFREGVMRESVIYQEIVQEGLQQGLQQGRQEGESNLILRLLTRRVGSLSPEVEAQIRGLSVPQLEELGEALLDFSGSAELVAWLENCR